MENKWPNKQAATDAIESIVGEYKSVGSRVVAEQISYLAEQICIDMNAVIADRDAKIARMKHILDGLQEAGVIKDWEF